MAEITVGLDIGTTAVKAVAADEDGRVLGRARVAHRVRVPAPDRLEHDADRVWRKGPGRALEALGVGSARAVSVVGMVPSVCAVSRGGRPRTPGLLYGDGRGRHEGGRAEAEGFLRWTAAAAPAAAGYWMAQAVANHALGGEAVVDTSVAASCSPLFSRETFTWDDEVVTRAGARVDQLPRVAGMGEAVGRVGDAVLDAGSVDALAEQIVAGAVDDGDVLVMCGTTLIVWAVTSGWPDASPLMTVPHMAAPGKALVGGPSNAGGLFLGWVARLLGAGQSATAGRVDPHAVPVWAPFPRGERSPFDDPARRASLHGLDLTHGPAAARRAAYEASGFVARRLVDRSGVVPRRVVVTGGGTRDEAWVQALADCTGLACDVAAVPEGAALGGAFLARMAAGLEGSLADAARWARTSRRVEPDPRWAGPVRERYESFSELAG